VGKAWPPVIVAANFRRTSSMISCVFRERSSHGFSVAKMNARP
jgi:hypothetical protein